MPAVEHVQNTSVRNLPATERDGCWAGIRGGPGQRGALKSLGPPGRLSRSQSRLDTRPS